MKKFLIISATIVVLLLISYFAFFKYREIQSNNVLIPANTNAVIKISVDGLFKTLAISYLKHPKEYAGSGKKDFKQKIEDLKTGLEIPANIYFYGLKGKDKSTFFSTFKISDSVAFQKFAESKLSSKLTKIEHNFYQSTDSTLTILFDNKKVAFAFAPKKDASVSILRDLLNQKNTVKIGETKFADLTDISDHLCFQNEQSLSKMNFTDGKVDFTSEFISKIIEPALKPQHRILSSESTISFWINAKYKADSTKKEPAIESPALSTNTLKSFYKDYIDIEWLSSTKQVDTVVGYEYNDNFERVEKKILQDNMVPNISINMDANATEMANYLKKYGLLNSSTGKISGPIIPFSSFYFKANQNNVQLSTIKNKNLEVKKEASDDFLYFKLNFEKLGKQQPFNVLISRINLFKKLEIRGRAIEKDKIKLESELTFTNENANSLVQILNLAQNGLTTLLNSNFNMVIKPPLSR
ncbi:hypothetical protein ACFOG5_08225 [Pedobacter fastidiosus]|uniref:DUF4836 domain-containing protein n=1 Tax=Pedobacter fastidiosus TaxID=2765361 RepID=A0ABR7KPE1_9SPHI|nr:hypothetical protein [Pedobacter fastidiosus]MBC6109858.1 hypothetical protein [Pedobacter fastidiosus]